MNFGDHVQCVIENHIATVTLENPPVNALNKKLIKGLSDCFDYLLPLDIRAVILTGAGKVFVAGADIKEFTVDEEDIMHKLSTVGHDVFLKIENFPAPVIAAINGFALGGGLELSLCCDIVLATERSKLGLPETSLGIVPGYGGIARLAQRINLGHAKKLIFTAQFVSAKEALEIGLVHELVDNEKLMEKAYELAQAITKNGPVAIRHAKKALSQATSVSIDQAIEIELEAVRACSQTLDKAEGVNAFLQKRAAQFLNK